jgi:hypothetical protein
VSIKNEKYIFVVNKREMPITLGGRVKSLVMFVYAECIKKIQMSITLQFCFMNGFISVNKN